MHMFRHLQEIMRQAPPAPAEAGAVGSGRAMRRGATRVDPRPEAPPTDAMKRLQVSGRRRRDDRDVFLDLRTRPDALVDKRGILAILPSSVH